MPKISELFLKNYFIIMGVCMLVQLVAEARGVNSTSCSYRQCGQPDESSGN